MDVWNVEFWVKKVVGYWWANIETTMNCCVFLTKIVRPNHRFLLSMIIENMGKWNNNYNEKIVWKRYIEKLEWIKLEIVNF
jgi:hypothetical protein